MTAPGLRLVRPLVVTGAVWLLAAGAHVLGGGFLPEVGISTALIALVMAVVMLVLGRGFSMGRIAAVIGIGQVLLHEALSLLTHGTPCDAASHGSGHHVLQASACLTQAPEPLTHTDAGAGMVLAHLVAAAVTAATVSRVETALRRVVAWFSPLTRILRPVTVLRAGPRLAESGPGPVPTPWRNHRADGIRGPPGHGVSLALPV